MPPNSDPPRCPGSPLLSSPNQNDSGQTRNSFENWGTPSIIITDTAGSTLTRLCFELELILDHIYSRKIAHFYCKSGLRFALAQSIAELIAAKVHVGVRWHRKEIPGGIAPIKYSNSLL